MHPSGLPRSSCQGSVAWPGLILQIPADPLLGQQLLGNVRSRTARIVSVPADLGCDKNGLCPGSFIGGTSLSVLFAPAWSCTVVALLILRDFSDCFGAFCVARPSGFGGG